MADSDSTLELLEQLPNLVWKGIVLPVVSREMQFGMSYASWRYTYRDLEMLDPLGLTASGFVYTIPLRQSINEIHPEFDPLFTVVFPKLLQACSDPEPGILEDPVVGPRRCMFANWRDVMEAAKGRDGLDVTLEFKRAPEEADSNIEEALGVANVQSTVRVADSFDTMMLGNWGDEIPPTLINPLDIPGMFASQALLMQGRFSAQFKDLVYRIAKARELVSKSTDPKLWASMPSLQQLAATGLAALGAPANSPKPVTSIVLPKDTNPVSIAKEYGMKVGDLLKLNPELVESPKVSAGTVVYVYR